MSRNFSDIDPKVKFLENLLHVEVLLTFQTLTWDSQLRPGLIWDEKRYRDEKKVLLRTTDVGKKL